MPPIENERLYLYGEGRHGNQISVDCGDDGPGPWRNARGGARHPCRTAPRAAADRRVPWAAPDYRYVTGLKTTVATPLRRRGLVADDCSATIDELQ